MQKIYSALCAATLVCGMGLYSTAQAAKPPAGPCDGLNQATCSADPQCEWTTQGKDRCIEATTGCTEGETQGTTCGVGECSGNTGNETCDASGNWINDTCDPLAGATAEVCDGLDNNCDGSVDEGGVCDPGGDPHDGITGSFNTPADVTAKCLECHDIEGSDIVNSLHGMMATPAPNVTNMTRDSQKLEEINTFCSYPGPGQAGAACLGCHPTLGKYENLAAADIDCLRCHNDAYKRSFAAETDPANFYNVVDWEGTPKTYIPSDQDANGDFHVVFNWGAMTGLTATDLIAGVHRPTTTTCLSCHAKAGGGDWTKRGDLGLSSDDPPPSSEDVHLASAASGGAGLTCSSCHITTTHKIPGRGIDLRPSEGGAAQECVDCHAEMAAGGHASQGNRAEPDRHVARVSCKSCHIPAFGKGGATELWRDWTNPEWNGALCNGQGAWAGEEHKEANVAPDHVFFNGTSYVYALGETLSKVDPVSGLDSVADANGSANDGMLVPIKRHQSNMAVMNSGADSGKVIPFDVVWQFMTGKYEEAAENGKTYAGYSGTHEWKNLEAEMALNHGVSPAAQVADCASCHHGRNEFEYTIETKLDKLGYKLKDVPAVICSQCHAEKSFKRDWEQMHSHTNKGSGIGCTFCHDIDRPERGLCEPCNPDGTENTACINEFVDTNYFDHCTP